MSSLRRRPRSAPSGADPRPAGEIMPQPGLPLCQSEAIPKEARGVSPFPPFVASGLAGARCARWSGSLPSGGGPLVRRGAQARDLPFHAVARICCWPHRLCLGSRLVRRVSLGGLWVGVSALTRARPARFRLPILLCPEWPSARAVGKYQEQTCWDPKDGELCLARMKPEETLVEVRSNSDVQIDCQSWV